MVKSVEELIKEIEHSGLPEKTDVISWILDEQERNNTAPDEYDAARDFRNSGGIII